MKFPIIEKFESNTLLPFKVIKGSVKRRRQLAANDCNKFYREYEKRCHRGNYTVDKIYEALDSVLAPNKIKYTIEKENDNRFYGRHGSSVKVNVTDDGKINVNHTGHLFYLPLDAKGENLLNKYILYHEMRHFFDHMYNPKYTLLRTSNCIGQEGLLTMHECFHHMFFTDLDSPLNTKLFKREADSILENVSTDLAIDMLQSARCSLQTEINAYKTQMLIFIKNMEFKKAWKNGKFLLKNCKFYMKLDYANKKLKEIITKERNLLHNNSYCQK